MQPEILQTILWRCNTLPGEGGRDPEADGEKNTAPKLLLGVDKEALISKERYNIEQERVFIIPDTNILLKQFLSHGQAAGEVSAK